MTKNVNGITGDQLLSVIERVERLEQDKANISEDIRGVLAEAKNNGFDTKIIKQIVKIRKQEERERQEQEALLETYMAAIGMADAACQKFELERTK